MYAIVAVDEKWGIGRDNRLLFHLPADLKRFKELTSGHTVLMGRKTLESLPGGRGLPNRRNIVLTGQRGFTAERAEIVHSPAEALLTADEDSWVIGGEGVYRMFLPLCDRVYVTRIAADGSADASSQLFARAVVMFTCSAPLPAWVAMAAKLTVSVSP